uniref:Zinc finger FYVE-type containing 27 n=1 Tax=Canis lupus familiaris TaxID=9615 RepID=A0A8I3SCL0_CANLF
MSTPPQSNSRPGSVGGGGGSWICGSREAPGSGASSGWGGPEATLAGLVALQCSVAVPAPPPPPQRPGRWQTPLCSLLTCMGLNVLFLTLNEGAWYSVGALMISVPALLGYLQEVCRARLPESDLMRRKYHSLRQEDLQKVRLSRPEAVAEVKSFLIQLEALLSRLCRTCEAAYRVLHWENPTASSQFYGVLLGTVCMLYLLPLCWVLALLNSTLFLGNVEFFRVVSEYRACLQRRMNPKQKDSVFESPPLQEAGGKCALPDCTPAPTPTEDLTPGSVEEAEEAEPDEEFKDAIEEDDEGAPCPAEDELVLQDNGFLSKNEVLRSKVSRLTERLRKRYPTNNFGNCTGCSATFSVLKKRVSLEGAFLGTWDEMQGRRGSHWATSGLGSEVCFSEQGSAVPVPMSSPAFPLDVIFALSCPFWAPPCSPASPRFLGWDQLMERREAPGVGDTSDTDHGSLQRSCSNCGNSFCSRCCSFKVPKSSMGATGEWGR